LVVRPYWKGYLKLALVSCPIALHVACSTAERIAFPQVNKPDLTIATDLLTLARHIVDGKATDFDPASFRDRYEKALLAHLKAKQSGAVQEKPTFATPQRVINLMEALRRSVAEDKKLGALPTARKRA
jgi:DNA end-binding protein Ku